MISRILLLSAIVATAAAVRLLGADECTWGPSHWCASLENAKKCSGSEEFCRKKVWVGNHPLAYLTKPIPEDAKPPAKHMPNKVFPSMMKVLQPAKALAAPMVAEPLTRSKVGGNCAICELVLKEILSKLATNATEEEVVEALEGLCAYGPASYVDECKAFVEEYGKEFYDEFIANVNAHDLCALMGLCSEEFMSIVKEKKLVAVMLNKNIRGIECDTCESVMALVQKELQDNEKAIEAMLDEICSSIPVDVNTCDQMVNSMFEAAVSLAESYSAEELCQMVGLCKASLEDMLKGVGPVEFGQVGQTGIASPEAVLEAQTDTDVLGTDDSCENGPGFWCASVENAKLCGMEEFCENQEAPIVF